MLFQRTGYFSKIEIETPRNFRVPMYTDNWLSIGMNCAAAAYLVGHVGVALALSLTTDQVVDLPLHPVLRDFGPVTTGQRE